MTTNTRPDLRFQAANPLSRTASRLTSIRTESRLALGAAILAGIVALFADDKQWGTWLYWSAAVAAGALVALLEVRPSKGRWLPTLFVAVGVTAAVAIVIVIAFVAAMAIFGVLVVWQAFALMIERLPGPLSTLVALPLLKPRPGQVWYVDFPFDEDMSQSKVRPCLVVGKAAGGYDVCKITSQDHTNIPGNYALPLGLGGLPKQSYIRVTPVDRLQSRLFKEKIGSFDRNYFSWVMTMANYQATG